jgi:uncharacterized coiled-coil protein SlyX
MTDRFIVDDAGTLIDIETRNTYDYVSDVCPLLNQLNNEIKENEDIIDKQSDRIITLANENTKIQNTIKEAYQNERTSLGKSVLKQLIKQME